LNNKKRDEIDHDFNRAKARQGSTSERDKKSNA
jgi:hypothetical protein